MSEQQIPFQERELEVIIPGPAGQLQLSAQAPAADGPLANLPLVAVICHPHPLHGGTMDNKVVTTLARTFRDLGVPAVRFNYRGVGRSGGEYDQAVGEVDDLLAVIDWLGNYYPGARLLLAGFSFGSAVAAAGSHRLAERVAELILVAPPTERYAYDRDGHFPAPLTLIMGDRDELVDVPAFYRWSQTLTPAPVLLNYPEASHFFHGKLVEVKRDLSQVLQDKLAPARVDG